MGKILTIEVENEIELASISRLNFRLNEEWLSTILIIVLSKVII